MTDKTHFWIICRPDGTYWKNGHQTTTTPIDARRLSRRAALAYLERGDQAVAIPRRNHIAALAQLHAAWAARNLNDEGA